MTTKELNAPSCYCILSMSQDVKMPEPLYEGSCLSDAAAHFVPGTIHGRGPTKDDAHTQAVFNLVRLRKL